MHCFYCNSILKLHSKQNYPNPVKLIRCFGCGILISDCLDFYYCSDTTHNFYMICSDCRLCKKSHFMQKCVYLSAINLNYINNLYGCDVCGQTKQVTDNGIWHCSKCSYDVCEECLP